MKYKLIIFDMDGTILNTIDDLSASLNYTLQTCGYPVHTVEEVRNFVGNGIRKLIKSAVPENTHEDEIDRLFEIFNKHYRINCSDKTKPYEGITDLLKKLRSDGIKTAVVSNKADYAVQDLCRHYFDGLFDIAIGEKSGLRKKPYADSVNAVLKNLDICKEDAVYIGDSEVDIQTAANAEINCIIVEWGFRDREFLLEQGAQVMVSDVKELYDKLIMN